MKHIYIISLTLLFTVSCNRDSKVEYYLNGKISKEYTLKNNLFNGSYIEYYPNGLLKFECTYANGIKIDSSKYYNSSGELNKIEYYSSSDTSRVKIYSNKRLIEEGLSYKGLKVKKWRYYSPDGKIEKVFEYLNVKGKQYTNQGWHFDRKGDTIKQYGNYFDLKINSGIIDINDPLIIDFKYKPILALNSNVIVCISTKINDDFSNINEIQLDTIWVHDNDLKGLKLYFSESGQKNLRGFVKEYCQKKFNAKDEGLTERYLYFNIPITVTH